MITSAEEFVNLCLSDSPEIRRRARTDEVSEDVLLEFLDKHPDLTDCVIWNNFVTLRILDMLSERILQRNPPSEQKRDPEPFRIYEEEVWNQMTTGRRKFWCLSPPESNRGLAEWDDDMDVEQTLCSLDPDHIRGGKRTTDLKVLLTSKRITDFVWDWLSECLIQDRVLRLFQEVGFTGFEVKPVKARMKIEAKRPDPCDDNPGLRAEDAAAVEIPPLWELVVTGWGGIAPPESGIRLNESCPACGWLHYTGFDDPSLLIDEKQWDGSDFFIVWPLPRFIFVTDRVAHFIRKHKLTGARLQAFETLRKMVPGGFSPGRLSYYMPEERARDLGDPLDIY